MSGKPVFSCYATNIAKLDEGEVLSARIDFPATQETVREALSSIGLLGINSSEYELSDFECPIPSLQCLVIEQSNIDELNYLATIVGEMTPAQLKVFDSAFEGKHTSRTVVACINLALNLDKYILFEGIRDEMDYGSLMQTDTALAYSGLIQTLENSGDINMQALVVYVRTLERYFDAGRYGEEISKQENGRFTHLGYLFAGQNLEEIYNGKSTPKEYCVTKAEPVFRIAPSRNKNRRNHSRTRERA